MDKDKHTTRVFLLMSLFALWFSAYAYSVVVLVRGASPDFAPARLTPMQEFLGWQGIAGMFAVAIFGLGLTLSKDSGIRNLSFLPALAMAVLLGVVLPLNLVS